MPCIDFRDIGAALGHRDPETLLGPILWLLTRLARDPDNDSEARSDCDELRSSLVAHLGALAAHSAVPFEVRLVAGALAIEYRGAGGMAC